MDPALVYIGIAAGVGMAVYSFTLEPEDKNSNYMVEPTSYATDHEFDGVNYTKILINNNL
jgi:hypothetical protein